jgi:hypothetical protein
VCGFNGLPGQPARAGFDQPFDLVGGQYIGVQSPRTSRYRQINLPVTLWVGTVSDTHPHGSAVQNRDSFELCCRCCRWAASSFFEATQAGRVGWEVEGSKGLAPILMLLEGYRLGARPITPGRQCAP